MIFSDSFRADAVGSTPSGWTSNGFNSGWYVSEHSIHCVAHANWPGSLTVGGSGWSNYQVSVAVKPSVWASEDDGLLFAVSGANHYSVLIVGGNKLVLNKAISGTEASLASTSYAFSANTWYTLSAQMSGGVISIYVNSALVMQVNDSSLTSGGIGLEANDPVSFDNVSVTSLTTSAMPFIAGRL